MIHIEDASPVTLMVVKTGTQAHRRHARQVVAAGQFSAYIIEAQPAFNITFEHRAECDGRFSQASDHGSHRLQGGRNYSRKCKDEDGGR